MHADGRGGAAPGGAHWRDMIDRWKHVGRPLKPTPDDIRIYERFAARAARRGGPGIAGLLLGVTPEIAGCRWPAGTDLTAVDSSRAMIDALWPAPGTPAASRAIRADWRALPLEPRTIDLVLGDGCNAALPFPDGVGGMAGEVARVLRPDGVFVLRAFVRPEPAETIADIARDLGAGRVGSIHVLKWRIFAALTGHSEAGVRLGDVWEVWNELRALTGLYGGAPGWSPAEIGTVDVYRGDRDTRFYFSTLAELRALMSRHFARQRCVHGRYELADRCPVMLLARPVG